jgi:hypothetical protein
VAHMVENLPSKSEAMDSKPSTTKSGDWWPYSADTCGTGTNSAAVSWDSVVNLLNVYSSAL